MKCPICRGPLIKLKVYGTTYLNCKETNQYFTPELEEIENITEYKNKIRREALKKYYNITNIDDENKETE